MSNTATAVVAPASPPHGSRLLAQGRLAAASDTNLNACSPHLSLHYRFLLFHLHTCAADGLYAAVSDGILLCKMINLAHPDTGSSQRLRVQVPGLYNLAAFALLPFCVESSPQQALTCAAHSIHLINSYPLQLCACSETMHSFIHSSQWTSELSTCRPSAVTSIHGSSPRT